MASQISTSITNQIINGLAGRSSGSFPSSIYLGLSSTAPTKAGGDITEPTTGGYRRILLGMSSQSVTQLMGSPSDGESENTTEIYFPESTGSWGAALTHYVLFSAQTGGTYVASGTLNNSSGVPTPITIAEAGRVLLFRPGDFKITLVED